jgi:hypothetical protein
MSAFSKSGHTVVSDAAALAPTRKIFAQHVSGGRNRRRMPGHRDGGVIIQADQPIELARIETCAGIAEKARE